MTRRAKLRNDHDYQLLLTPEVFKIPGEQSRIGKTVTTTHPVGVCQSFCQVLIKFVR